MCGGEGSPELRIISGILHARAQKKKIRVYFPELGGGGSDPIWKIPRFFFFLMNPSLNIFILPYSLFYFFRNRNILTLVHKKEFLWSVKTRLGVIAGPIRI